MRFFFIAILFFSITAFSQNSPLHQIDSICNAYDLIITTSLEEEMNFYPPKLKITSTSMKRAIGEVNQTIIIYFDNHESIKDQINEPYRYPIIRKVNLSIQSGSFLITESFYFNEQGKLVKYNYAESGYSCYSQVLYFNEKCFEFNQTALPCEDDCESVNSFMKTELGKEEQLIVNKVKTQVANYTLLLKTYFYSTDD